MSWLQLEHDSPHIKIYSQKENRAYCKGEVKGEVKDEVKEEVKEEVENLKEPSGWPKPKPTKTITNITDDIANTYVNENLETVTNYLRNKRVMKTQRKQMNARSLLNNAF